jgi:hypothetical protein
MVVWKRLSGKRLGDSMIKKIKGQYCTISCHHDPGKIIACFPTEEEANAQHSAIMTSKYAKKIEIDINKL